MHLIFKVTLTSDDLKGNVANTGVLSFASEPAAL